MAKTAYEETASSDGDEYKQAAVASSDLIAPKEEHAEEDVNALDQAFSLHSVYSARDPGPPPDGGFLAWSQSLMGHLVILNSWGLINSFGVFQTYYVSTLGHSASDISWIGSFQIFLLFFIGTYSGRALDAGLFNYVYGAGAILQTLGILTTSWGTKYYQIFLSHGICVGIGNGLMFCPAMAVVSTYFTSNKSLALTIGSTGSVTGGIVFPIMIRELLPKIGFGWTVRAITLIIGIFNLITLLVFKPRIPPRKAGPIVEWAAFKERTFVLYVIGMFLSFWGVYFAFFYVSSFARNFIHFNYSNSANLVIVMSAVGLPGRLIPGVLADRKYGPINTIIPCIIATGIVMYCWAAVNNTGGLYAFSAVYGFVSGGVTALFPPCLSSLTTDLSKTGVRMGMGFTIVSFSVLSGPPLAGALISAKDGHYLYAQMWGGSAFLLGAIFMIAARISKVGKQLNIKV